MTVHIHIYNDGNGPVQPRTPIQRTAGPSTGGPPRTPGTLNPAQQAAIQQKMGRSETKGPDLAAGVKAYDLRMKKDGKRIRQLEELLKERDELNRRLGEQLQEAVRQIAEKEKKVEGYESLVRKLRNQIKEEAHEVATMANYTKELENKLDKTTPERAAPTAEPDPIPRGDRRP